MLPTKTPLPRPLQRRTPSSSFPRETLPAKITVKRSLNSAQANVRRTIQAAFRFDHPLASQCLLAAKPIEDKPPNPSFWNTFFFPTHNKTESPLAATAWCNAISAAAQAQQSFILPVKYLVKIINEAALMSNSKIEVDSKLVKIAIRRMRLPSMECLEESELRSASLKDATQGGLLPRLTHLVWSLFGAKNALRNTEDQLVILYALLDDFLASLLNRLKEEKNVALQPPATSAGAPVIRDLLKGNEFVANYVMVKTSELIRAVEVQFPSVYEAIGRLDLRGLVIWRLKKLWGSCEIYSEEGALLIGEEEAGKEVKARVALALR